LVDEADLPAGDDVAVEDFVDPDRADGAAFSGTDSVPSVSVLVAGAAAFADGCVLGEEAEVEVVVTAGLGATLTGLAVSGVATGAGSVFVWLTAG
jgi:hypothetical protein